MTLSSARAALEFGIGGRDQDVYKPQTALVSTH